MKTISIKQIRYNNFKGIENYVFSPSEHNTKVFGKNATNKTTLMDGYLWCLFGKDSQGKANFSIKTMDKKGKVIPSKEHSVEVVLFVEGDDQNPMGAHLRFKRIYEEKYSSKRGSYKKELTGHETTYIVNERTVKKKEYEDFVSRLVSEEEFSLLSDPRYFNEQLHWKDRRTKLLSLIGNIPAEEVIEKHPEFEDIKKDVVDTDDKKIENGLKTINHHMNDLKKEIDKTDAMLEMTQSEIFEVEGNQEGLEKEYDLLEKKMNELIEEKVSAKMFDHSAEQKRLLMDKQNRREKIKNDLQEEIDLMTHEKLDLKENINALQMELENLEKKKDELSEDYDAYNNKLLSLKKEWKKENNKNAIDEIQVTCPTCERELSEDMIEDTIKNFNRNKAEKMTDIREEGKKLVELMDSIDQQIDEATENRENINMELSTVKKHLKEMEDQLDETKTSFEQRLIDDEEFVLIDKKIEELSEKQGTHEEFAEEKVEEIQNKIDSLKREQVSISEKINLHINRQKKKESYDKMEYNQKKLIEEYEWYDRKKQLILDFVVAKVKIAEDRINNMFEQVEFKLFEQQVSGGVVPVCEVTFNGIPYGTGLNNGHRIIAGLSIIKTFSQKMGLQVPIWIDNAESITEPIEVESQVIRLIVSEEDEKLRVEVDS